MRLLLLALCLACSYVAWGQGTTTGSITGKVTDESGVNLIGVTIVALHTPSGTTQGTITNDEGYFRLENLRVGGPYRVSAVYLGYGEVALEGIEIRLGESQKYDFTLQEEVTELTTVDVVASAANTGENAGASTQISTEAIERMPTLNRDIDDFLRLTPQAAGYSDGTTFAGVNNRYNAIYIDGAVNNDVFGIASSGTNGGQTGISPFSMDIIDQFQVALSPYDVSLGGFAGAAINAVTKSGTNNMEGTAYYFFQNESMVGKTNQQLIDRTPADDEPTKVAEFTKSTFGASLGGPIIKDKLFFFVNAELQEDETPSPFNFGTYGGNSDQDDLNALSDFLKETYDYDPGTFGDVADELDGVKFFAKLDWNLGENHRLTLRHNYTKAEQFDLTASTSNTINFSNTGVYFPSTTNSSAAELNSQFGENNSNNLIVGYTTVLDDRDPIGSDLPFILIEDGGSNLIRIGSEEFSTGNRLETSILSITDNFKIYSGAHTFTIGTHNEFYDIYNMFISQNYGTYRFANDSIFMAGGIAKEYDRSYSLVDDITGDGSAAAADFNAMQLGLYFQDEWIVSDKLSLMGGVRFDMPIIIDDPNIDEEFNTIDLPLMQAQYEVAKEVEGGKAPEGQLMIAPRLGFTYLLSKEKKTVIRGGAGIFTSRIPFVWPGAMFNTNGLVVGRVDETTAGEPILFRADIQNQYENANFTVPSGDVNLFTKDFKYPQIFRGNLGFDFTILGLEATVEGIYTKTINNVLYTNINNDELTSKSWTGVPDTRTVYTRRAIDPVYGSVYVGSNTDEGDTYSFTASVAKRFGFGLYASVGYTYGDANALNEGTSSQNSSQWRGQMTQQLGRNNPVYGRSDFALGNRIMGALSQQINWGDNENLATTISLFYDGMAGSPYSYVIGGNSGRNINNDLGSTGNNRALVWVPASETDIRLVDIKNANGDVIVSAHDQWLQLDAFIQDDPYLVGHRGQYAEKNSNFMPFTSFLDMSIRQDLGVNLGNSTHKFQISLDVFNLLNMLNNEWGVRYSVPGNFNNFYLYDFVGYEMDGTTPKFNFVYGDKVGTEAFNINDYSSRWQMRLGLRYMFE